MTWLTLRQFRIQFAVAFAALAALAVVLLITGSQLAHLYDTTVANCSGQQDCSAAMSAFNRQDGTLKDMLGLVLLAVPSLVGIFWGAPLIAHELESGTFRLAWTQSVSRRRWLAMKLAILCLASVVVAGILSLLVTWWSRPYDNVNLDRFNPGTFDERGIVAIGYAAFACAMGAATGMLYRRTIPAMATTLALFIGVRLAFVEWVRPHLVPPEHLSFPINGSTAVGFGSSGSLLSLLRGLPPPALQVQAPNLANAWTYSTQIVDKAGAAITSQFLASACPDQVGRAGQGGPATKAPASAAVELKQCAAKVGEVYHGLATYQPADRYWTFQVIETVIFIGIALAISAFCFWWVRRRIA